MKALALLASASCLVLGRSVGGIISPDTKEAIKIAGEQYGVRFKFRKKPLFTGGVTCNVKVRCDELPGKDIRVFRFDKRTHVQCDYIYVKYGDAAYEKICRIIQTVLPAAKVLVEEFGYNHFYGNKYDKSTTLDDYLRNNMFKIRVITYGYYDTELIRSLYNELAEALLENGVDSYGFAVYVVDSQKAFDEIKISERMPDSQAYRDVTGDHVRISAANDFDRLSKYAEKSGDPGSLYIRNR